MSLLSASLSHVFARAHGTPLAPSTLSLGVRLHLFQLRPAFYSYSMMVGGYETLTRDTADRLLGRRFSGHPCLCSMYSNGSGKVECCFLCRVSLSPLLIIQNDGPVTSKVGQQLTRSTGHA